MSDTERNAAARDLPRCEPELRQSILDIDDCHRLEISIGRLEHDKGGLRYETWPEPIQHQVEKLLDEWRKKHPERELRAVTSAATATNFILVIHHGMKGAKP